MALSILDHNDWPSPCREKYDPATTILIPFGPKRGGSFVDKEGNPADPINPKGISGAGVWLFDPDNENSEDPKYSLLGIQHSYESFYQVLIATRINPLIEQIQKDYGLGQKWLPEKGRPQGT